MNVTPINNNLEGRHILLEPISNEHLNGLVTASAGGEGLYKWSPVPQGAPEVTSYIATALSCREANTAVQFAIIRTADGTIIGSTRFWNLEKWLWPPYHARHNRNDPDACEIGYTWLSKTAIRTSANTEAKLLMLTYAFETWGILRVCFHTDERNTRSRMALERIGGQFEGILRAHRLAADYTARNSARYSIIADEWPAVKQKLYAFLNKDRSSPNS